MKKFMVLCIAVAGFAFLNNTTVEAGHRHGNYYGNSYGSSYGYGYGCNRYRRPIVHRQWHDTSHYDYHPGGYVRHNNHYDYVPGHYDYHRTGHWDTHVHH